MAAGMLVDLTNCLAALNAMNMFVNGVDAFPTITDAVAALKACLVSIGGIL